MKHTASFKKVGSDANIAILFGTIECNETAGPVQHLYEVVSFNSVNFVHQQV